MSPTEFAALAVAQLLAFTRTLQATKAAWGLIPPKYQWLPAFALTFATEVTAKLQSGVSSWTDVVVPVLLVLSTLAPGMRSNVHAALDGLAKRLSNDPTTPAFSATSYERITRGAATPKTAVMTIMLCFLLGCATTGCAEFTKDAETALKVLAEANAFGTNAATWLDQYESAIVDLAPSSDRALLQVDLDKGRADLQAALTAGADVSKMTEDALLKNYAAFIADAEKLATDAEQAGLFKAPAASSNAVAAGASPPPAPMSSPPPLPLVVLRAKGQA